MPVLFARWNVMDRMFSLENPGFIRANDFLPVQIGQCEYVTPSIPVLLPNTYGSGIGTMEPINASRTQHPRYLSENLARITHKVERIAMLHDVERIRVE